MTLDWDVPFKPLQTKEEWLAERKKGIGSSDMPVIMGLSPWRNVYQLWLEKTGQEEIAFGGNYATERGNRLEPTVRGWVNKTFGMNAQPMNMCHAENDIWRASFDGVDLEKKFAIEIKCPGKDDHKAALSGKVPDKYIPQVQWLLMICGYDNLSYVSFNDRAFDEQEHYAVVNVASDIDYQNKMKQEAIKFWEHVVNRTIPKDDSLEIITDPAVPAILAEYQWLVDEIAKLEKMKEDVTYRLKKFAKKDKSICNDYALTWVERKGSVDYSKISELESVDLDKYRKPSSKYLSIKRESK